MSACTLYLDCNFVPLRVEPWQRAITDLYTGKTEVVEYSRDRTIQGVSRTYQFPSVVRVIRRFRRDKIRIKFSRLNIYARDNFVCQYCCKRFHTEDLTFDHVMPRSRGGKTEWTNIVTADRWCNMSKGDRTPSEAGMTLAKLPKKPHSLPTISVRMSGDVPEEWKQYWTVGIDNA